MSRHSATIRWTRTTADFQLDSYDRGHSIVYGTGTAIAASAAPDFHGDPTRVNPEEALVGALSSCHMLTFLAIAARKKLVVDRYEDDAEGELAKNADGKLAIVRVVLRPRVGFSTEVDAATLARLHASAHDACIIAQSVRSEVVIEPRSA
jgi:organic hydroperoxide reductase OsmC/OhrA